MKLSAAEFGWKVACQLHSAGLMNTRWIGEKKNRDEQKRDAARIITEAYLSELSLSTTPAPPSPPPQR
jgi:hypothetical protein